MTSTIRHVIVDRDGVLNIEGADGSYLLDWAQWHWAPGALEGLRLLTSAGVRISVATNQSAVGRGFIKSAGLDAIHAQMVADAARSGATISAVFVCPHAPGENCACRKPEPGLVLSAIEQSRVPANETMVLGDDLRDLQAAWRAGVPACLVRTGKGNATHADANAANVPIYGDLRQFAAAVLSDAIPKAKTAMMIVHRVFFEHGAVVDQAAVSLPLLLELVSGIVRTALAAGNKILACGNGGSAATAQHLVAELVGRFQRERRALAAIALTSDSAIVSAIANDYGYERVFARQVEALAGPGDVLIALSTSGNSPNVVEAARTARAMDCRVVALTGIDGGALAAHADTVLRAPSKVVARIQEIHDICIHVLAEAMEDDPTPAQRA